MRLLPLLLPLAACVERGFAVREDDGFDTGFECGAEADTPLRDGFVDQLVPDGCRWMVTALDDDGYRALFLDVPAFAAALAGESVAMTYTLPDDDVRLEVLTGCGLAEGTCSGDGDAPFVARTYTPTAGTVTVDLGPDGDEAVAMVTLADVELVSEYDETATIDAITWSDVRLYPAPAE